MNQPISNEQEFNDNLKTLGDLYEEGKDIINKLTLVNGFIQPMLSDGQRMHSILKQMRDIAATQMQHKHFLNGN